MTTKNDLLERYLQAVGEYLPMMSKADTLAELRANLLDQMEAREDELGRELTQDDMAALLRAHGKPELVALRYLPQRSLIGPTIFPFYVYTLRKALPLVLLAYAVASGATLMSEAPTGDALVAGLARAVFHVVPTLIYFVGVVTVVFAMLEASKSSERVTAKLSAWDPLQMEKVRDESGGKQKSFVARLVDLGVHILWMAYVLALPRHPFWILGPGTFKLDELGVGFAPVWHTFYCAADCAARATAVEQALGAKGQCSGVVGQGDEPCDECFGRAGAGDCGVLASGVRAGKREGRPGAGGGGESCRLAGAADCAAVRGGWHGEGGLAVGAEEDGAGAVGVLGNVEVVAIVVAAAGVEGGLAARAVVVAGEGTRRW